MLNRTKAHLGIIIILGLYLAAAIFMSIRVPLHLGSDEVAHFMFARFLRENGYLPLTPEDRREAGYKSDQPPLNAALVAAAYSWAELGPPLIKFTEGHSRRQLSVIADNYVGWQQALHTEDPWLGEVLFWRIGRLVSTLSAAATLLVIYLIGLAVFFPYPRPNRWALAAVMPVAFIPTFVFISSVFSYESLLAFWMALYLLAAVYIVRQPARNRLYVAAGLLIGLAMVTKLSALAAPLSLVVLTVFVGVRAGWPVIGYGRRLALGGLGIALGAGWWFLLIIIRLNRVAELGWAAGLIYPVVVGDASDPTASQAVGLFNGGGLSLSGLRWPGWQDLVIWLRKIFETFWRYRDQGAGPESGPIYVALAIITLLVFIGLVRVWWKQPVTRVWIGLFLLQIGVFTIFPLMRFLFTGSGGNGHNGHHILFPAAGAFGGLIAWGLGGLFPERISWRYGGGMVLGLLLLGWSLLHAIQIYYPPLPIRTVPPLLPESARQQVVDFGPVALAGYEVTGLNRKGECCLAGQPALNVTLYWQAQEYSQQDYLTEVIVVDTAGQVQSAWLGYPANGRYPTRAWDPGDGVRDEIWLPVTGLAAGRYDMVLRLLQADDLVPVGGERASLTLTQIEITEPLPGNEEAITVWQQGRPGGEMPRFDSWQTIQITVPETMPVKLIGPDQASYVPLLEGGRSRVFIVDPRWPKRGEYTLLIQPDDHPARQTGPILLASGRGRKTQAPESQVAVKANFADQLKLLGYNLPDRRFQPGEEIPVMLHLQALTSMPADFLMFTRLRDRNGQVWGGRDRKPMGLYSPMLWVPGEVVEDGFTVKIEAETPPGIYYLDVGFYLPVAGSPVSLPIVQEGQFSQVTSVSLGPIKIGQISADFMVDSPAPQFSINQPLGEPVALTLLGYDLTEQGGQSIKGSAINNRPLTLTLYWRAQAPLAIDYTTFVHIRNSAGENIAQKDQPPVNGIYPTSLWEPGETIADEITVPLPEKLPPGMYSLVVGMYDYHTLQRLAVPDNPANEVTLTTVSRPE